VWTAEVLSQVGIETEVIDVQTLLPFDRYGAILESLKKTSRICSLMRMSGWRGVHPSDRSRGLRGWMRAAHWRCAPPACSSDGDYWSKPNVEQVFEMVYALMREADPGRYPVDIL
jgi:hypothetical protein